MKLDAKRGRLRRMHCYTRSLTAPGAMGQNSYMVDHQAIIQGCITKVLFEDMLEEIESQRMEAGE
jgi:hypothetical protein